MSPAPSLSGRCPNCGSALTFELGSSRLKVCEYCKAAVARAGQDLSVVGTVADLIPTGSRLALGQNGKWNGLRFTLLGQVQLEWKGGVWDEWYASFSDGRWGWVSEAGGTYYVLFRVSPRALPPRERARAGQRLKLEGLGPFIVTDVKDAKLATCRGELPEEVVPGEVAHSVDLQGAKGAFATIDYGSAEGDPVQLFVGATATLAQLGLGDKPQGPPDAASARMGDRLTCPNCNGSVSLKLPDQSQRVTCPYCNALLDTSQGALRLIEVLARHKRRPPIPLGTTGTLAGEQVLTVGWMRRSCVVEGETYDWEELLLYAKGSASFLWLVVSDGHWCLARPISAAEVEVAQHATYRGKTFKRFGEVAGTVEEVLGEFNWAVSRGDQAWLVDFTAPPEGLSLEQTNDEVNWSHCRHLDTAEVAKAFALTTALPEEKGVGTFQPWPHEATWRSVQKWTLAAMGVVVAVFLTLVALDRQVTVLDQGFLPADLTLDVPEAGEEPPPGPVHGFLSGDLELKHRGPVSVRFQAGVNNAWAAASGALVNQDTGELVPYSVDVSLYSGVDEGERWQEGDTVAEAELGTVAPGKYLVRADLQWDPQLPSPPPMQLVVRQGGVSWWQFLAALAALCLPFSMLFMRNRFEQRRWENSTVMGGGGGDSSSDSDDEDDD